MLKSVEKIPKTMQKELWKKEYQELKNLPSSKRTRPSKAVVWFINKFVKTKKINPGKALDVGSGQGRNAIYLARQGYDVIGTEIVKEAIEFAKQKAKRAGIVNKIRFIEQNAGEPLPFKDKNFDLVIDMATMHLFNSEERAVYKKEVVRLLKQGGMFLFYTIAADSPLVQELLISSPGPEPNSYIVPQTGMIEKGFTEKELVSLFHPLKLLHLERKTEFTPAFGDVYERVYYLGLMSKL